MGDYPLVSVVVPLLNEVKYVRAALDSLLAQDYEPLEVLVYDGGSTDGTLEVLRNYPFEVVVEPGLSQMAAINRGWRRTHAEFVTWMAGDDFYKSSAIRRLAEELLAHPEVGFVHADADVADESGRLIKHVAPGEVTLRDLVTNFEIVPQTTLIRRSALLRAGMMDESRRLAADWDLFLRLAQYYPSRYVPFIAAVRRLHRASEDMRNIAALGDAGIDVVRRFFERPDLTVEQRALRRWGLAGAHLMAAWCYCVSNQRYRAWLAMLAATQLAARIIVTPRACRLLIRLLSPVQIPPPWERM
jgi:glycosyltransferase involved in cell wall biosynthesis